MCGIIIYNLLMPNYQSMKTNRYKSCVAIQFCCGKQTKKNEIYRKTDNFVDNFVESYSPSKFKHW